MNPLRALFMRLRGLFGKERRDHEFAEELESHLQMHIEENLRAGMTPEEARRQALVKLGGVDQTKESYRERRGLPWFETLVRDVRFGLRMLRKNPGFTAAALLTMALGIGATTAIFTVTDKVLLEPAAYPDPEHIVLLMQAYSTGRSPIISIAKYLMWRDLSEILQDPTIYGFPGTMRVNLLGGDRPKQLRATQMSMNFFSLFGVSLEKGRAFNTHEDEPGGPRVVVISDGLWRRRFAAGADVVGRTLDLDGTSYTVIGVTSPVRSPDLDFGDLCLPMRVDPSSTDQGNDLFAAARLKPGVTLATAKAASKVVGESYYRKYPNDYAPQLTLTVETIREARVAGVRSLLLVLLGAVGFVLLIACANVNNLMLARAAARKREIAIRAALGARRRRIVQQVLTESLLASLAGGALGVFLGYFGVRTLLAINPANLPRIGDHAEAISLDWRILVCALALSLLAGTLAGILPAIKTSRADLAANLKESGPRGDTGLLHSKTRSLLVVMEVSLAMTLLVGSALLIRTFVDLRAVNPGFETHNILAMDMSLIGPRFQKTAAVAAVVRDGRERLKELPGVDAAAVSCCLPLEPSYSLPFNIEGRAPGSRPFIGGGLWRSVSPEYFELFRIPILAGRIFNEGDDGAAQPVVVINETMVKQFWPNGNEIGARISIAGKGGGPQFEDPPREVVGVVGDVRDDELDSEPIATMYVPIAQMNDGLTVLDASLLPLQWLIRTRVEPHVIAPRIERELRIASGGLPIGNTRSMNEVAKQSISQDAFGTTLLTTFGAIALFLCAIGIYGVVAYSVEQRTQEIGIRMALGASPPAVRRMVVFQGMILALVGVSFGIGGALALTRLMRSLLYGVKPWDPISFAIVVVLLSAVALFAAYVPAWRASRVDPMVALRYE